MYSSFLLCLGYSLVHVPTSETYNCTTLATPPTEKRKNTQLSFTELLVDNLTMETHENKLYIHCRGSTNNMNRSNVFCLSKVRLWMEQVQEGNPDIPLQLLQGDSKALPSQKRYIIPPMSSRSDQESPPSWACPKTLQREATWRHRNQMPEPPQLTPFNSGQHPLYSELHPGGCAPQPISKAEPSNLPKETHLHSLVSTRSFFP